MSDPNKCPDCGTEILWDKMNVDFGRCPVCGRNVNLVDLLRDRIASLQYERDSLHGLLATAERHIAKLKAQYRQLVLALDRHIQDRLSDISETEDKTQEDQFIQGQSAGQRRELELAEELIKEPARGYYDAYIAQINHIFELTDKKVAGLEAKLAKAKADVSAATQAIRKEKEK